MNTLFKDMSLIREVKPVPKVMRIRSPIMAIKNFSTLKIILDSAFSFLYL